MKKKIIVGFSAILAIALMGLGLYLNRVYLSDWLSSMSYKEPAEVLQIEKSLGLTSRASLILRASHPELETRTDFNENCKSYNVEISVLGCYSFGVIHVYNIDYDELNGIVESTMAHELLHAAWWRLEEDEKEALGKSLMLVYEDARYQENLKKDLKNYEESELLDELHSRIGTEIKDLPNDLEKHYAKFFTDQDEVVKYYDKFSAVFKALKKEREEISVELKDLKQKIDDATEKYKNHSADLTTRINNFNECAGVAGCFKTEAEFYTQRNQLMSEKEALNSEYESLNNLVIKYNDLVEKYNQNVLRNTELDNIINSNIDNGEVIK